MARLLPNDRVWKGVQLLQQPLQLLVLRNHTVHHRLPLLPLRPNLINLHRPMPHLIYPCLLLPRLLHGPRRHRVSWPT